MGLQNTNRKEIGIDLLERYTGSQITQFQPYILLTNFEKYLQIFAEITKQKIINHSVMHSFHDKKTGISMINYGVGSPVAALIVELLSFIKTKATLMLGMCGGLRRTQLIGEYFNPVAAIREDGLLLLICQNVAHL